MPRILLTAHWTNLLVVNYETEKNFLKKFLPAGTELNDWNGKYIMSLVGFEFSKIKLLGIPSPFFRHFAELNLRFYVKRKMKNGWRKGVVFIKEIAPHKLIGKMAGWLYKENFIALPITAFTETAGLLKKTGYEFKLNGGLNFLKAATETEYSAIAPESIEDFISDHYYGYTKLNGTKSKEFRVYHRPWKIHKVLSAEIQLDTKAVYGKEFEQWLHLQPLNTFLMDGSETTVSWPVCLEQ
jgi:uncharacterized protein YqjF (DUF2071 family)